MTGIQKHADKLVNGIFSIAITAFVWPIIISIIPSDLGAMDRDDIFWLIAAVVGSGIAIYSVLMPLFQVIMFHFLDPFALNAGRYVEIYNSGDGLKIAPFDIYYDLGLGVPVVYGVSYSVADDGKLAFFQRWRSVGEIYREASAVDGTVIRYLYGSNFKEGAVESATSVTQCLLGPSGGGAGFFCHVGSEGGEYIGYVRLRLNKRPFAESTLREMLSEGIVSPKVKFSCFREQRLRWLPGRINDKIRLTFEAMYLGVNDRETKLRELADSVMASQFDQMFGENADDVRAAVQKSR